MLNPMEKLFRCRMHILQLADDSETMKYLQLVVMTFCRVPAIGHSVNQEM